MTVVKAKFYQQKKLDKKRFVGFEIFAKTNGKITEDSIFWWLMSNLLKRHIQFQYGEAAFDLTKRIQIDLYLNKTKRIYIFRKTIDQTLKFYNFLGHMYTINLDNDFYKASSIVTNLEPFINYIEWSRIKRGVSIGPLISVPM